MQIVQHLRPSGVLSCWPDGLKLTAGFYPGSSEQRRLFRRLLKTYLFARYGPITIAIRARFEYDSTTIRLQHATTRYEVFRALVYEIVYENQW